MSFTINRDSPQARGLVAWWPLISPNTGYREMISGALPSGTDERIKEIRPETGSYGSGWDGASTSARLQYNTLSIPLTAPYTLCGLGVVEVAENFNSILGGINGNDIYALFQSSFTTIAFMGPTGAGWNNSEGPSPNNGELVLWAVTMRGPTDYDLVQCSMSQGLEFNTGSTDLTTVNGTLVPQIGNDRDLTSRRWRGPIFDVRVYDRGLTGQELWALFAPQTRWDLYQPLDNSIYVRVPTGVTESASSTSTFTLGVSEGMGMAHVPGRIGTWNRGVDLSVGMTDENAKINRQYHAVNEGVGLVDTDGRQVTANREHNEGVGLRVLEGQDGDTSTASLATRKFMKSMGKMMTP